jgi:hypothetical protein
MDEVEGGGGDGGVLSLYSVGRHVVVSGLLGIPQNTCYNLHDFYQSR